MIPYNFLSVNWDDVLKALGVFWKGMLAIAIVIAVIICVTVAMNAIDKKAQESKKQKELSKEECDENKAE